MEKTKTKLIYNLYGIDIIIYIYSIESLNKFFIDTQLFVPDYQGEELI